MKTHQKVKYIAILLSLTFLLVACGKDTGISAKKYDFYTRLKEVEAVVNPMSKTLTEDMYISQTEMNELSGEIFAEWQAFMDEILVALEDNLSKKDYKALLEEQEIWQEEAKAEVEAYVAGFGDGSMAPLLYNMEMEEKLQFRVYDLANYFSRP